MDKYLYKVDFMAKTITITAECAERMNDPDTTEYKAIRQLCADFPAMKIVKRTHRTPRKYVSKSTGEKFNCNQFKNLTYENMETFISGLPNAEQYMMAFNFLKDCGSLPLTSRYPAVRRWFVDQFPEFRKNPLFYLYNEVSVINFTPYFDRAKEESKEKTEKKAEKQIMEAVGA